MSSIVDASINAIDRAIKKDTITSEQIKSIKALIAEYERKDSADIDFIIETVYAKTLDLLLMKEFQNLNALITALYLALGEEFRVIAGMDFATFRELFGNQIKTIYDATMKKREEG